MEKFRERSKAIERGERNREGERGERERNIERDHSSTSSEEQTDTDRKGGGRIHLERERGGGGWSET